MFKRQQNESAYDKIVTDTERVFPKWLVVGQLLVKNCHNELHKISSDGLVADFT